MVPLGASGGLANVVYFQVQLLGAASSTATLQPGPGPFQLCKGQAFRAPSETCSNEPGPDVRVASTRVLLASADLLDRVQQG